MIHLFKWSWIIAAISLAGGIVALALIEPGTQVPMHWNADGQVDRYGSPLVGFLILPVTQIGLLIIFSSLKWLEPRKNNLKASAKALKSVVLAVSLLMLLVQVMIIDGAFGGKLIGVKAVFAGLGVMLMVIGNYFSKLRSTFFIGIRTPWTLSSDTVWQKTHRLGGKLFVAAGVILSASALVLEIGIMPYVIAVTVIPAALVPAIYSWYIWREEQQPE